MPRIPFSCYFTLQKPQEEPMTSFCRYMPRTYYVLIAQTVRRMTGHSEATSVYTGRADCPLSARLRTSLKCLGRHKQSIADAGILMWNALMLDILHVLNCGETSHKTRNVPGAQGLQYLNISAHEFRLFAMPQCRL